MYRHLSQKCLYKSIVQTQTQILSVRAARKRNSIDRPMLSGPTLAVKLSQHNERAICSRCRATARRHCALGRLRRWARDAPPKTRRRPSYRCEIRWLLNLEWLKEQNPEKHAQQQAKLRLQSKGARRKAMSLPASRLVALYVNGPNDHRINSSLRPGHALIAGWRTIRHVDLEVPEQRP